MKDALARVSIIGLPLLAVVLFSEVLLYKAPEVFAVQSEPYKDRPLEIKVIDKAKIEYWIDKSILQRPVFSRGRRPPQAITNPKAAYQTLRLSGIIIAPGVKCAILDFPDVVKPIVIDEGMAIADTYIVSIQRFQVLLANGIVLKTSFDKNSSRQHRDESSLGTSARRYPADPNFQTFSPDPSSIRSTFVK